MIYGSLGWNLPRQPLVRQPFSPAAFSPAAFSPAAFSPAAFSPAAFSPAAFSPAAFSPAAFSPAAFQSGSFQSSSFQSSSFQSSSLSVQQLLVRRLSVQQLLVSAAFSGAQSRSLIAISAFEGQANEGILFNTWNNPAGSDFYIRVKGRNGAYNVNSAFQVDVTLSCNSCADVAPVAQSSSIVPTAGNYQTIVLVDYSRIEGSSADITALQQSLQSFVNRPEVAGIVVDVNTDARVAASNAQADANPNLPLC